MKPTLLRVIRLALPLALLAWTFQVADAKPSRGKRRSREPLEQPTQAPTMTFEPEETGQPKDKPGTPTTEAQPAPPPKPKAPPQPGPPTKSMDRAIRFYDNEDYYASTIELNKVIEGQSGDDDGNRQRAEFYMGKALFQLKYYATALTYFDRIVQKGPEHGYYNKTLQWLASLSQYLPDSAGVLDKIGTYTRQDLEQPALESVREQLYYLLGRFHYTKGTAEDFKEALQLFALVPEKSDFYVRAKYFEGMTYIRQYQAKPASDSFKAILRRSIEKPDKNTREFEQVANISLARTFYSLHQFPLSVKYYDRVAENSPYWLPALFESSWAHFQIDNDAKALGNIHTINAPYFENEFFPESLIVKAVIYFQRCQFERAMETIAEFNQTYPALKREIDTLIATNPNNDDFFAYILKIRNGEAGLSERVQRAAKGALSDKTLAKSIDYVNELDRELKAVEKADPAWRRTGIASAVLQDLTLQKSLATNEAGNLSRERLKRLSSEIQDQVRQAIKVEFETLNKQKIELQAIASRSSKPAAGARGRRVKEVVVDDEHEKWPFDGEYWKDELGYYRVKVVNKCVSQ
jgi:tetratricopeptide (TPR) repeat protein